MRLTRSILALSAASASVIAGAGPASAGTAPDPGAAAAAKPSIVDIASADPRFDTLTSLVKRAGLASTLDGGGPYTVFAPTDAAFAKVPERTLKALAADRKKLRSVLLLHATDRRLPASKVVKRKQLKMLSGERVAVRVRGETVRVGGARVIAADVRAGNGVIHVVDRVLEPR